MIRLVIFCVCCRKENSNSAKKMKCLLFAFIFTFTFVCVTNAQFSGYLNNNLYRDLILNINQWSGTANKQALIIDTFRYYGVKPILEKKKQDGRTAASSKLDPAEQSQESVLHRGQRNFLWAKHAKRVSNLRFGRKRQTSAVVIFCFGTI